MIDENQRAVILELTKKGFSKRRIASILQISRGTVGAVIKSGGSVVPKIHRTEKATPYREQIIELYSYCRGNLVRVHEELAKELRKNGHEPLSYQALTGFCRRHEIGHKPKPPSGRYDFAPGLEMQHDTSPYPFLIAGKKQRIEIASLVLFHSRMIFIRLYPCFTRFECKLFLTDALSYFDGACKRCMVDNTSVIRLKGTGPDMIPVPEMVSFGERFGFKFVAHEVGDANRSARVEGHFRYVQGNFFSGRTFTDWDDANAQAHEWCEEVNAKYSRKLKGSRRDLFVAERRMMQDLPDFVPDVYVLHHRIVDAEGYVNVRCNRYSAPYQLIGRQMEVRESKNLIEIFEGPRKVASHRRVIEKYDTRVTEKKHRLPLSERRARRRLPPTQQAELLLVEPSIAKYVEALVKQAHGRGIRELQQLLRMVREYPRKPFVDAIGQAEQFNLYELDRVERMVLTRIDREYFTLPEFHDELEFPNEDEDDDNER